MYWEDRAGESGPAESAISACVKYLEVMLPVDDLKGASRAIAPGLVGQPGAQGGKMAGQPAGRSTTTTQSHAQGGKQIRSASGSNAVWLRSNGGARGQCMVASLDAGMDCCRQVELDGRHAQRHSGRSGNSLSAAETLGRRRGRGLRKGAMLEESRARLCGLSPRSPIGGVWASGRERFPAAAHWMAGVGRELDTGPRREVCV